MDKIKLIQAAIEKAQRHESKMDEVAWSVPALSSLKIRHLMNNLGAISTRYLECGVHKGGLFCSTIRNNTNLEWAVANDNWASDETSDDKAYPQFINNAQNNLSKHETAFVCVKGDTFEVEVPQIGFDLYLFDADHSYESQRRAMTHFLPAMADVFIYCCDDWQYGEVKKGTIHGLIESDCKVIVEWELTNPEPYTDDQHLNDLWWRGFYIALLKKKP